MYNRKIYAILTVFAFLTVFLVGCGQEAKKVAAPTTVKAVKVIKKDTDLFSEYPGQIRGKNEANVQARVTGNVVEKFCEGGQWVKKGQPLFRIDSRAYESAYLSANAQLAQTEANFLNVQKDTYRYQELYKQNAISEQSLATQESSLKQNAALVNAQRALAQKALDDLNDTVVVSPIDGRLNVNDVSIGTFVTAGSTVLVTVGETNPVFVEFNMSENEYLELRNSLKGAIGTENWGQNVEIKLSNNEVYPSLGTVTQIDKGFSDNSGTLTIKATFDNPNGVLLPGMFARAKIKGVMMQGALLVPQRSVQQVLDKSYVMVITSENKAESRPVILGQKTGSFWIVKEGLTENDTVVVEGLTKLQNVASLNVEMIEPKDLNLETK